MSISIEIDRFALWKQMGVDGLTTRLHPAGTMVRKRGSDVLTPAPNKVYRFAKDYTTEAGSFCLFVRTYETDSAPVKTLMDAIATHITEQQVLEMMSHVVLEPYYFDYLDYYIGDDVEPIEPEPEPETEEETPDEPAEEEA